MEDWWKQLVKQYVHEQNKVNNLNLFVAHVTSVPLEKVYEFLIRQHLTKDLQMASKLVKEQQGFDNLKVNGCLCLEEFCNLFTKGMFKFALVNLIDKITAS